MLVFLIKELRKIKNITLKELKEDTGLSISYLSELENNKVKNPSLFVIVKIAKALDTKLDEIYFASDEINSLERALNVYVEAYGLNDEKTLKLSEIVNDAINHKK